NYSDCRSVVFGSTNTPPTKYKQGIDPEYILPISPSVAAPFQSLSHRGVCATGQLLSDHRRMLLHRQDSQESHSLCLLWPQPRQLRVARGRRAECVNTFETLR